MIKASIFFLRKSVRPRFSLGKSFGIETKRPEVIPTFNGYKFIPEIVEFVNKQNILTPSPIQQLCFNHFSIDKNESAKRPIFIGGPTGSGKTLAFLLPIFHKIKSNERKFGQHGAIPNHPSVIILSPSKELINQTYNVAKQISHLVKLKVEKVDSASNWKTTKKSLDEGVDILLTNTNKLSRLVHEQRIVLSNVRFLVFDEADVFLESGEEEELVRTLKAAYFNREHEEKVQLMFVSATLTPTLKIFLDSIFEKNIKFLLTTDTHFNLANLNHDFIAVQNRNKLEMLTAELERHKLKSKEFYFIVFCNSMSCVRAVTYYLNNNGFNCGSLHSDMPVRLRAETYENFKNKKMNVLVCSDLAARGLDFTHLLGVVNFDFPKSTNDYIHRSGRAGRIGNAGYVITFYNNHDLPMINALKESNDKGIPLEITKSMYSLAKSDKKNSGKTKENSDIQPSKSNVPAEFIDFRKKVANSYPLEKVPKTRTKPIAMKRRPNFTRRKVIDIKKSIKTQLKLQPNGKRVKYLKRSIKNLHKEELRSKGKLPIRK